MCGRFHFSFQHPEVRKILDNLPADESDLPIRFGDVYPTDVIPVVTTAAATGTLCRWGFKRYDKKGVMINARAETVTLKPTFRSSFLERRCLIPACGFYEWEGRKRKYYFKRKDDGLLYLCGFYRLTDEGKEFMILTKPATPPVSEVHHRIPVLADGEEKERYLSDTNFASTFIEKENLIRLTRDHLP